MEPTPRPALPPDANLDDDERALIGRAVPSALVFLSLSFTLGALVTAGLPPLSGFLAKVIMFTVLLSPHGLGSASPAPAIPAWCFLALLIASGFATTIAMLRLGIRYFWAPEGRPAPVLRIIECLPVAALMTLCVALVIGAGPVLQVTQEAAESLLHPERYIEAVTSARPVDSPAGTKVGR
jgi:multicomponent K+:H+ antiporter subunit D